MIKTKLCKYPNPWGHNSLNLLNLKKNNDNNNNNYYYYAIQIFNALYSPFNMKVPREKIYKLFSKRKGV